MMRCIYGVLNPWCAAPLLCCIFGEIYPSYNIQCVASLVLCICTFGMLCIVIFGVLNLWCAATVVNYILVAIFLCCTASSVRCIFGVMCTCTFGMLCKGIFRGASLVRLLLCNASLVHCFLVLGAISTLLYYISQSFGYQNIVIQIMVQNGSLWPQQWSDHSTPAYMGSRPPTR